MKRLLKLFLVGVLISGCSSNPVNPWDSIEIDETPVEAPLNLPKLPKPKVIGDTVVLTAVQAQEIRDYGIISRANTVMADEYAQSINERKRANTALVESGQAQRAQTEILRETLGDERWHHFWQTIGWVGLAIAAVML